MEVLGRVKRYGGRDINSCGCRGGYGETWMVTSQIIGIIRVRFARIGSCYSASGQSKE